MGYDQVIDYTREDFTKNGKGYDLILDVKTNRSLFHKKYIRIVSLKVNKDLEYMNGFFEAGKLMPVIDGSYQLAEVANAFKLFETGKHKGKIVITV